MNNLTRITLMLLSSLMLAACGSGSDSSSEDTSTPALSLPSAGSNSYAQAFNLGSLWSGAFRNLDGYTVTIDQLTQTLHTAADNGSWSVSWDGEYEGVTFTDWTAFGYEETPDDTTIAGRFYFYHHNTTIREAELLYYRNGRIYLQEWDVNGTLESMAMLVPQANNGLRIITRVVSDSDASVIILDSANGTSSGIAYEGCTANIDTLISNTDSCTSSVVF